jgi:23S rRNA pseudouridine1911/1915/1917 synthase
MILFEDERLLAVSKTPGVSMATSSREGRSAVSVIARLLSAAAEPSPSLSKSLFLVHRLDVGTSGVVLLAKTEAAHRALSSAFQERRVTKTYRALAWGHPVPAKGLFDDPLGRDPKDGRKMRVQRDGKPAVTEYVTLRRYPSVADLRLSPKTGRTHQIRVHLAAKGHPIVGDDLYGGATRWRGVRGRVLREALARIDRPLLHAERIEIPEMGLDVAAPLLADYEEVLRALERPGN